jgi:hypothetical protein
MALRRPSSELQNSSRSFGLSRQIEYGVDRSSVLMAVMREVGVIKPSPWIKVSEVIDGTTCGNEDMRPYLLF